VNAQDSDVLAYLRKNPKESVLVILNMSEHAKKVAFDLRGEGIQSSSGRVLLSNSGAVGDLVLSEVQIEPYGTIIAAVQ